MITVPFFSAALSRVKLHETGSAAGLLNSVQQLGAALGIASLGAIYLAQPTPPHVALSVVFAASVIITLAVAIAATGMLRTSARDQCLVLRDGKLHGHRDSRGDRRRQ